MADLADMIKPSQYFDVYTGSFPRVLTTLDPAGQSRPCRAIRATGSGTVTVKRAGDGATVALPFVDGETQMVQCSEVTSITTVTGVTVLW